MGNVGLSLTDPTGLHLNSVQVTYNTPGNGPSTLKISLQETGLMTPFSSYATSVGGTTTEAAPAGGVRFETWYNGTLLSTLGTYSAAPGTASGSFGGSVSGSVDGVAPFTLEQIAYVTHTGFGVTSFDMHTTVPEPATLAMLGLGLLGIGFSRRRNTA
jgi:hypothetical protein